jgi:hypothetical protein
MRSDRKFRVSSQLGNEHGEVLEQMLERLILQQLPNKLLKKQPLRVTISTSFQKPSKQLLKLKTINSSVMGYLCNPLSVLKVVSLQRRDCQADGLDKGTIPWSARQAV